MLTKILVAQAQNGEVSVRDRVSDTVSDSVSDIVSDRVSDTVSDTVCGKVTGVDILSAGKAASKGILIISEDKKVYIALPMDSISKILDLLETVINKIVEDVPTTIPPQSGGMVAPTLSADMKIVLEQIKQLKENLQ